MDIPAKAEVIVVCCQKGGVGKTTTTVNNAAIDAKVSPPLISAELEKRLITATGRPDEAERSAYLHLRSLSAGKDRLLTVSSEFTEALEELVTQTRQDRLAALPFNHESVQPLVDDILTNEVKPQVLAVSTDPQRSLIDWLDKVSKTLLAEGKPMPIDYAQEHANPRALAKLKQLRRYRRIHVDSPGWLPDVDLASQSGPTEKVILQATLESADLAVVIIEPEDLAFRPTRKTIEEVITPMGVPYVVVFNNWDPRDGDGDLTDMMTRCQRRKWPIAQTVIRRYKVHTTAPAAGLMVTTYKRNRKTIEAVQDYTSLNLELPQFIMNGAR